MTPPVVLVTGLQKSGTSLMLRLLTRLDGFSNPVRREGKEYWGDDPPFSPEAVCRSVCERDAKLSLLEGVWRYSVRQLAHPANRA